MAFLVHVYINPHMLHTTTQNHPWWNEKHTTLPKVHSWFPHGAWVVRPPQSQAPICLKSTHCQMLSLALGRDAAYQLVWSMHACMPVSLCGNPSHQLTVSIFAASLGTIE